MKEIEEILRVVVGSTPGALSAGLLDASSGETVAVFGRAGSLSSLGGSAPLSMALRAEGGRALVAFLRQQLTLSPQSLGDAPSWSLRVRQEGLDVRAHLLVRGRAACFVMTRGDAEPPASEVFERWLPLIAALLEGDHAGLVAMKDGLGG